MPDRTFEQLTEEQCLELIAPGGIGRISYNSRYGPTVLPVNYALQDGAVVFRTAVHGPLDEDLRTGIADADYRVAFEIDSIDLARQGGWSVLIVGPAHHVTGTGEDAVRASGIESWAPGERELFVHIVPSRITGRRVRSA